jgi:nucleotide-binding universal stress UspA family protein
MYKQIVVGTDGSAGAEAAVDQAIELARLTGATLHIVNAYKLTSAYQLASAPEAGIPLDAVAASNEALESQAGVVCNQAVERAGAQGIDAQGHCLAGDAADALISIAKDVAGDLVVVGNRGMTGARRFVLGSVPNRLSHHCPSSLLIVDTASARS